MMRSCRSLLAASIGWLSVLATNAAADSPTLDPESPVPASKIIELDPKYGVSDKPFFWIDDERILFSGWEKARVMQNAILWPKLYIWHLRNGVQEYSDLAGRYCYANSRLFRVFGPHQSSPSWRDLLDFAAGRLDEIGTFLRVLPFSSFNDFYGPRRTYMEGSLESQKKGSRRFKTRSTLRFNDFSCRVQARPSNFPDTPLWQPLRDGDGAFVYQAYPTPISKMSVTHYVGARKVKSFDLKSSVLDAGSPRFAVEYIDWMNKYFIWEPLAFADFSHDRPPQRIRGDCIRAWWYESAGNPDEVCIPRGPWNAKQVDVYVLPIRRGYGIVLMPLPFRQQPAPGFYVVSEGRRRLVQSGFIGRPRANIPPEPLAGRSGLPIIQGNHISPDGCKVAIIAANTYDEYRNKPESRRGLVVDACSGGHR